MTTCGENYLGQNSRWEHFGLGLATGIDSITVHWPSGVLDKYYNLQPNQSLVFMEGEGSPSQIRVRWALALDARTRRRAISTAVPMKTTAPVTFRA